MVLLLAGCGPEVTGNNSAIVRGPPIGTGEAPASELRKRAPVAVVAESPRLEVGRGWLMRDRLDAGLLKWIVEVHNISPDPRCGVRLDEVRFMSDQEGFLADDASFVIGDVSDTGQARATKTCVLAGETRYVTGLTSDASYEDVDSLIVDIDDGRGQFETPDAEVLPLSYGYDEEDEVLTIDIENRGSISAIVSDGFTEAILVDGLGEPLTWMFVNGVEEPEGGILQPGQRGALEDIVRYEGRASAIHVFVDFEDVD
jgi:hypothetical protein